MKLQVLPGENFSCQSCTRCCRDLFVQLMPGEPLRILGLKWGEQNPLKGAKPFRIIKGKTFLAHRKDSSCVFLNDANGLCLIHAKFGPDAKPLGCRVFPFHIKPTFENEASVAARYDCPSIRKNSGIPVEKQIDQLRRYATEMDLPEGFDEDTRCLLDRDQIQAVAEFVSTLLPAFETDSQRALFICLLADWLRMLDVQELNRQTLGAVFAPLKEQVMATAALPDSRVKRIFQLAFRTLLCLYLRRDEDILNHRAWRLGRVIAMTRMVLGGGGFRQLGVVHPAGSLRKAALFSKPMQPQNPDTFALHWRMVRNKIDSFQFMGMSNGNRDFLTGLRSMALLYPLVFAAAKYRAANRGALQIQAEDVDYAVGEIEHSHGKLAILHTPLARFFESLLLEPVVFAAVVRGV